MITLPHVGSFANHGPRATPAAGDPHDLGWSHRTDRRPIAALMNALGADTRFQAGLYAARRNWL